MHDLIRNILEHNPEFQKEYLNNVFFRASLDSLIKDYSPANVISIVFKLCAELKSQFNEKVHEEMHNPHPVKIKIPADAMIIADDPLPNKDPLSSQEHFQNVLKMKEE